MELYRNTRDTKLRYVGPQLNFQRAISLRGSSIPHLEFIAHNMKMLHLARKLPRYHTVRAEQDSIRTRTHPGGEQHPRHARHGPYGKGRHASRCVRGNSAYPSTFFIYF